MAKAKQRFAWRREASNGTAIKVDQSTDETLRIDGMEFPQAIREEIFVYGISKIIDDRLSQVAPDAKMSEARTLVAQLISGEWKACDTGRRVHRISRRQQAWINFAMASDSPEMTVCFGEL